MKSFFEKLTGTVDIDDFEHEQEEHESEGLAHLEIESKENGERKAIQNEGWMPTENEEGELTVDMYQDGNNIIIKTMVAGVKPEDLDVGISRDTVTIKGKRSETRIIDEENYFSKELYWGSFARTITLPEEINIEEAKAEEKHGLLTITLPKNDIGKQTKLRVKSS